MRWTQKEIDILENNSKLSLISLQKLLPNKTLNSIKLKRSKLGLKTKSSKNWSKEEIEILKNLGSTHYNHEIAIILNRSIESVAHKLKRLKINKTKELMTEHGKKYLNPLDKASYHYYKLDQTFKIEDLDNITYQILIGSMLGDGGIKKHNYKNDANSYVFSEDHGLAQKNYVLWKREMLYKFDPTFSTENTKPCISTPCHPIFKQLRNEFYDEHYKEREGRKAYIPLKYIEKLDELGLLIWYLDDGCLEGSPIIYSTLFSYKDLNETVNILNSNMNLKLILKERPSNKSKKSICFHKINRDKIMPIWWQLVNKYNLPECMWYKLTKPVNISIDWLLNIK